MNEYYHDYILEENELRDKIEYKINISGDGDEKYFF